MIRDAVTCGTYQNIWQLHSLKKNQRSSDTKIYLQMASASQLFRRRTPAYRFKSSATHRDNNIVKNWMYAKFFEVYYFFIKIKDKNNITIWIDAKKSLDS